jgi:site-specific recombinase XerC
LKNKYFIGAEYSTIKEKNEILAKYDDLQKAKIEYLNIMYDNENTLKNAWSLYNRHIHQHEEMLGKDVMYFNDDEIDELMANKFNYAKPTKNSIMSFINIYKRWGVDRGDINGNSVKGLNVSEVVKDMKKVLANRLWGLGKFYNLLERVHTESSLQNAMILLLARYGILGKEVSWMRNLKWEDVDYENKYVRIIEHGQLINKIPVDDRFLSWVRKQKEDVSVERDSRGRNLSPMDLGYVIKKSRSGKDDEKTEKTATIYTKTHRIAKDLGINRIALGDLVQSRKIDMLLEIRAKRKLKSEDLSDVIQILDPTYTTDTGLASKTAVLRDFYESLTGDEVVRLNTVGVAKDLTDKFAKEYVEKLRKTIQYEEFINVNEYQEVVSTIEKDND